ncbi:MAG: hypothetical protein NTX50_11205 [Candidatus Sumerlaeota bacterium]|nr:hypothetical protein [Candidatus Sumerlaeota bacterium]
MKMQLALCVAFLAISMQFAMSQPVPTTPPTAPGAEFPGGAAPAPGGGGIPPVGGDMQPNAGQPPAGGEGLGVPPTLGAMPGGQYPGQFPGVLPNGMRPAWAPQGRLGQPGMPGQGGIAPAITGPEGLTPADRAVLKRFAESDWFDVRLSAGSRVYTLGKENKNINYVINRGGFDISKGSIPVAELVDKTRPASGATESKAPGIAPSATGGTLRALKAWRYEIFQLPDGKFLPDRVEYDAEDLNKVKEDDIKFYEDLYRQNPPLLKENEMPADPHTYAEWFYDYQQLRLWEMYVQRLIGRAGEETKIPSNPKELSAQYAGLYEAYNQERDLAAEEDLQVLRELFKGMADREQARAETKKAEKEKMVNVEKYAQDWARRDSGDSLQIEGTNYIRTDEPLRFTPANSVNIVGPSITPHDLLNDDGTVKKPATLKRK